MAEAAAINNNNTPSWRVSGDWFDVCNCNIPCPCIFAQTPTYEVCEGIMAYHINRGSYGETILDGLNALILDSFKGNIWAGDGKTKLNVAIFFDEKANEQQREALNMIFSGKAGGFLGELFANIIGEVRGIEFTPIKFEVADDLSFWSAEIEKVVAKAEALVGPMTPPGKRVQTINAPGSETGPGTAATGGSLQPIKPMQWLSIRLESHVCHFLLCLSLSLLQPRPMAN